MLKAITFDLWGTLFDESGETGKDARRCHRLVGALEESGYRGVSADRLISLYGQLRDRGTHRRRVQAREYPPEEQIFWLLEQVGVDVDWRTFDHLVEAYVGVSLDEPPRVLDGAREVLASLAETYQLTLICNTGATPGWVLRPLLDQAGLLPYLKSPVFSNETGVAKPHPLIFRRALDGVGGFQPQEAVHIGDDPVYDVQGPQNFGMKAVWIDAGIHTDKPQPDAVVHRLRDVPAAIAELAANLRSATA